MTVSPNDGSSGPLEDEHYLVATLESIMDDLAEPASDEFVNETMRRFGAARRYDRATSWRRSLGLEREEKWGQTFRSRLYRGRLDRLALVVLGCFGVIAGIWSWVSPDAFSTRRLVALGVAGLGVQLVGFSIQSGRAGFFTHESIGQVSSLVSTLDELEDALDASIIQGHEDIHELESSIVARAGSRLLTVEMWNQPRRAEFTTSFSNVQKAINARLQGDSEFSLESAVSATPVNWMQCRRLLRERVGFANASQDFFFSSPLQLDLMLSEDEALLGFPKAGGDREFGIHIRSPRVVQKLREIFSSHLRAQGSEVRRIQSPSDINFVGQMLQTEGPGLATTDS